MILRSSLKLTELLNGQADLTRPLPEVILSTLLKRLRIPRDKNLKTRLCSTTNNLAYDPNLTGKKTPTGGLSFSMIITRPTDGKVVA